MSVLYLIPYELNGGVHGGKIRAQNLAKAFRSFFSELFIVTPDKISQVKQEYPDWLEILPVEVAGDIRMLFTEYNFEKINLENYKTIIFEQPWYWNSIKKINSQKIYSSQNLEWKLKNEVLKNYAGSQISKIVKYLRDLEIEIAKNVDLVIAVTEEEASWYRHVGARNVIVVPNGANDKIRSELGNLGNNGLKNQAYTLVVGSAHPPNIAGCINYLGHPALWLPPDKNLVIAGSLGSAMFSIWESDIIGRPGNIHLTGEIDEKELSDLIDNCNSICLPVDYGAGSNLKTAEALVSGRPIVSTESAFRGYESFAKDKNIVIAREAIEFKLGIMKFMWNKFPDVSRKNNMSLSWDEIIKDLILKLKDQYV
jgi:hypothetical protein